MRFGFGFDFGLGFGFGFGLSENEAVVKEEVENHGNDGSKDEGAGGEDEFIREGEVDASTDVVGEFVEGGKEAEELDESGADSDSEDGVPDEKTDDGAFGDVSLFPSDFGVGEVGNDNGDRGGDKIGEPKKIVVVDDKIGKDDIETVVEEGNKDADDGVFTSALRSRRGGNHFTIIARCRQKWKFDV